MDLLAHNIANLHGKLRETIDAIGWSKDYETSLEKTISGFIFRIDKTADKEKWVNYPVAIEVLYKEGKIDIETMREVFDKEIRTMTAQFSNLIDSYETR